MHSSSKPVLKSRQDDILVELILETSTNPVGMTFLITVRANSSQIFTQILY